MIICGGRITSEIYYFYYDWEDAMDDYKILI